MDATLPLDALRRIDVRPTRLTRRRRRPRPKILVENRNGVAALVPSTGCRWEAADLVRVRDRATALLADGSRRVGVDLTGTETLPSGFFAQLYHWHERGAEVVLFSPGPAVRRMLWFRAFMDRCGSNSWRFVDRDTPAWISLQHAASPRTGVPSPQHN